MEKVTLSIPSMWADHHVLAVRDALSKIGGVKDVIASALYQDVQIMYEPGTVTAEILAAAIREAGYETDKGPTLPPHPKRIDDASDWFRFQERVTETDMRDIEMSGDYRKY